jgi:hypothetical protein
VDTDDLIDRQLNGSQRVKNSHPLLPR